jgi:hypothetical protein
MAVLNVLSHCFSHNHATQTHAPEIACTSGDLIIQLITTVWIAPSHVVVVPNSEIFRLWFIQLRMACNAHQPLKLSLATLSAAQ